MSKITIYTDGSSRGNPGPGGWGAIIIDKGTVREVGGGEKKTTNNRMEIKAAIEGLKKVENGADVEILTDSAYLLNGITKWVHGWQKNNWITKTKEPVLNKDLWLELLTTHRSKEIEWKKVGGHSGEIFNDRCDAIATSFADGKPMELFRGTEHAYRNMLSTQRFTRKLAKGRAYSYVSEVGGKIEIHKTWEECKERVQGKKARFRKSSSAEDEREIIADFKHAK